MTIPEHQTKEELEDFIKGIYEKSLSAFKTDSQNDCEDLFNPLLEVLEDWKKSLNDLECSAFPGVLSVVTDEVSVIASEKVKDLILKHGMEIGAVGSIPLLRESQIEPIVHHFPEDAKTPPFNSLLE